MNGRDHLITGAALLPVADSVYHGIAKLTGSSLYDIYCNILYGPVITEGFKGDFGVMTVAHILGFVLLYALGLLLPDIDSEHSTITKLTKLPIWKVVDHRTWTHSIWGIIILIIAGILVGRPFLWLAFGIFMHLFVDSLSKMGVCWFYPISHYVSYPNGGSVKANHKVYCYRTGEVSEYICTGVCVVFGCFIFILRVIGHI